MSNQLDRTLATQRITELAMRQADNRLPDAAGGVFAAWMSLVHAEGLPPAVQALLINTAMMQMKQAIRDFNERHAAKPH